MSEKSEKILIADSNPIDRVVTENVLRMEGYDVSIAVDGESALMAAKTEKPDMIIIDARTTSVRAMVKKTNGQSNNRA